MDLSQQQLAKILHISQRSYSRYERGESNIPDQTLIELANVHGTSIDYIVGRTDDPIFVAKKTIIIVRPPTDLL